jgi:hypothetical protein
MQARKELFECASQACEASSAHLFLVPRLGLCLKKDPNMHYKSKCNFINKILQYKKDQ